MKQGRSRSRSQNKVRFLLPLDDRQCAFLNACGVDPARVLDDGNAYCCEDCGEHFRSTTLLDRHQVRAHEAWKFACSHCGRLFKTRESKAVHVSTFHHNLPDIRCDRCGRSYSCRKYFLDHACEHQRRALERIAKASNSERG